ncbi:hypothetical protein THMIRHAM_00320 [Thiomicrorhabdus immobilis]|uniref:VacJ family lipoprotein n=1 Tax=Thiomicrorhabdus immobilis TaxID=2791037 RepID=A0ABM7MA87_9GAMM|nr:VacJ family lipoprotein [Thiomicrorhabdus immobilis]BCN92247.1 hypothetical protein THMIRHAM_00320 [Thiomicrorhabdus immobilis]
MKLFPSLLLACLMFSPMTHAESDSTKVNKNPMNPQDPYESFNRVMFDFNMGFNDTFGRPIADAYNGILPQPARTGINNVFDNLKTPLSAINCFLQGKVEDGLSEIMRFTLNSTFGLLGLLDVAEPAGLEAKYEDFGQTLFHWGVWNESSYLVLPIVGSYTTRELVGGLSESSVDPIYATILEDTDTSGRIMIFMGDKFVKYTKVVKLLEDIKSQPDPYVFSRESYLQYRTNLIFDGKAPQANLDDFNFE